MSGSAVIAGNKLTFGLIAFTGAEARFASGRSGSTERLPCLVRDWIGRDFTVRNAGAECQRSGWPDTSPDAPKSLAS
jgi:hypothetical protein